MPSSPLSNTFEARERASFKLNPTVLKALSQKYNMPIVDPVIHYGPYFISFSVDAVVSKRLASNFDEYLLDLMQLVGKSKTPKDIYLALYTNGQEKRARTHHRGLLTRLTYERDEAQSKGSNLPGVCPTGWDEKQCNAAQLGVKGEEQLTPALGKLSGVNIVDFGGVMPHLTNGPEGVQFSQETDVDRIYLYIRNTNSQPSVEKILQDLKKASAVQLKIK